MCSISQLSRWFPFSADLQLHTHPCSASPLQVHWFIFIASTSVVPFVSRVSSCPLLSTVATLLCRRSLVLDPEDPTFEHPPSGHGSSSAAFNNDHICIETFWSEEQRIQRRWVQRPLPLTDCAKVDMADFWFVQCLEMLAQKNHRRCCYTVWPHGHYMVTPLKKLVQIYLSA